MFEEISIFAIRAACVLGKMFRGFILDSIQKVPENPLSWNHLRFPHFLLTVPWKVNNPPTARE